MQEIKKGLNSFLYEECGLKIVAGLKTAIEEIQKTVTCGSQK